MSSMWEMWSRQEPWQDIKMPYVVRVSNCLQRNQRPPMPPDTPLPLRNLIELCWATNFKDRPTPQEILKIHLPQLDELIKAKKGMRQQQQQGHQRRKAESLIVAPVTQSESNLVPKAPSSEFISWENFLFASTSAPELMAKMQQPAEVVTRGVSVSAPPSLKKALDSPVNEQAWAMNMIM